MTPRVKRPLLILGVLCAVYLVAVPSAQGAGKAAKQAEAQLAFGVDMARRGLWSEALFRFRQADELDPNNPHILNNLAVANEAIGNFEEALALYRKALELRPGDRELRRNFTRFIEFYQSYKPEGEQEGATDQAPEAEGGGRG